MPFQMFSRNWFHLPHPEGRCFLRAVGGFAVRNLAVFLDAFGGGWSVIELLETSSSASLCLPLFAVLKGATTSNGPITQPDIT